MKKILLVDDEIVFRETIRDCIDWSTHGFIYCGDASDGEMALPLIEEMRPDILITDVSMPFMNGLELCSIVTKSMPEMKIIILSGHGEFEYARTALRMGIEDYCLKPLSSAELIQTLQQVSVKIDCEREEKSRIERLKRNETDSAQLSRQKLLNDLCSGFMTTIEALHLSSSLQLNLVARYYIAVTADWRSPASALDLLPMEMQPVLHTIRILQQDTGKLIFQRSKTETVWILKGDTLEQLQAELQPFRLLQQSSTDGSTASLSIGIGCVQDRLQNVHLSFLEAVEDMHWRRLSRQNRHALWEITSGRLDQSLFLDRGKFIQFLKTGTAKQLEAFVWEYTTVLKEINWKTSPIGYYILNDLTIEVFRSAKDLYRHLGETEELLHQLQEEISQIHTWRDTCSYLVKLAEQFWSWRSRIDKYNDMLNKAKQFIADNYNKDTISLQDAADHVKVSPSHLSKVFSQETGQTFIEFLTQMRINKAMELLKTTSAKSYEIAYRIGYNDAHYFSNLFKRLTGMTTKEFRKSGAPEQFIALPEGD